MLHYLLVVMTFSFFSFLTAVKYYSPYGESVLAYKFPHVVLWQQHPTKRYVPQI